ncbi:aspartate/glutamate racemase family protein [Orrella sp. JC864]|uniref:aspartate/glutamate racemase family protein n=1 Tax=Orrella sp. JC864 TaxID=3120298 RepID=UPI0012BCAF7D
MKIKIVNPNTTWSMTDKMQACARQVAAAGTQILAVSPSMGPVSIESHYDEALAVPGLIEEIRKGQAEGCDAYVIACFGDPGLDAARELASGPVIGIAEAAMHCASLLGTGFSVVTTLGRTCGQAWHLAERYGMTRFCRNVRACELPVLALEEPGSDARRIIEAECRRALHEDRSDVIVLGCAGMADLGAALARELGVPVVEGVSAAVKLAESLVALGCKTSKRGDYAAPPPKPYEGELARFSLQARTD